MRKVLFLWFCLLFPFVNISCSDDKEPSGNRKITISSSDSRFSVDESGAIGRVRFGPSASEVIVNVASDVAWTHSFREGNDWCTISRSGNVISVKVSSFLEQDGERSVTFDLLYQGEPLASVSIIQNGEDDELIKLSTFDALIHGTGGTVEIEVSGLAEDWDFDPVENTDWVTPSRDGNKLTFSAGANTGDQIRKALFQIWTGPEGNRETVDLTVGQPTDKEMVLQYTTTSEIPDIYLPFAGDLLLTVDWGDGSPVEILSGEYLVYEEEDADHDFIKHSYATPGTYTVSITGEAEAMYCGHIQQVNLKSLTELKRWGNLSLKMMYNAITWSSLKKLPASLDGGFKDVLTFYRAFHSNSDLEYIEEGLFNDVHKSESFEYMFAWCYGLKEIGPNMFRGLQSAASFECAFFFCEALETIGEGFAVDCKATSFKHAFFPCHSIKKLPAGMFSGADNCRSFESVFQTNLKLEEIPDRLFENCSAATDFMYAFYNCKSVKKVGKDIFKGCTRAERLNSIFSYCEGLEQVDEDLFAGLNPNVSYVNHAFSMAGLKEIPEKLLYPLKGVKYLSSMFNGTKITRIPARLFRENVALEDIGGCFSSTQITEIPEDLLENGWQLTNVYGMFSNTPITRVPAGLFRECFQLAVISELFSECTQLEEIPVSLFDNCKRIERMDYAFYNCSAWTGASPFTEYDGQNVELYRRSRFTAEFTAPSSNKGVFHGCTGLTDYALIESDYPEWIQAKPTYETEEI